MKKIVLLVVVLLIFCGCSEENSLIKNNYIESHAYAEIYSDLNTAAHDVSYFPTKEKERDFYELIEVIRDNYGKFSNEELKELYRLMNVTYNFHYNEKRYNNDNFKTDLETIKSHITE